MKYLFITLVLKSYIILRLTGSGQANINCSDKLKAMIDGTADVVYTSNSKRIEISSWLGRDKYAFSDC